MQPHVLCCETVQMQLSFVCAGREEGEQAPPGDTSFASDMDRRAEGGKS
jgi:hypothetical protein